MMRGLEIPEELAGVGIESEQTIGVQVRSRPVGAVEAARRVADGQEDHAALFIHADQTPHARAGSFPPSVRPPGPCVHLARSRDQVKAPDQLSSTNVERPWVAARPIPSGLLS